ncbi:MAG: hypothetical protein DRJ21_01145 [Candidatus Methanomethylicota archaeon]|uniref:ABC transmembrane type-1 domain-containing protein n=1 Tax=Thermoproteota archaeon TaxID=2056631 RepID=A0A497EW31_9CREN|nr:MAG: hypothetical protein DRJ21_01145 [Candidatus Verstraetearchaeota archaeon]
MSNKFERYMKLYRKTRWIKLRMFWDDFKHSKLGMCGLIMLIIFIIISILVVTNTIIPAEFPKKWRSPGEWSDYPELVPPEWWLKLTGQPIFPHTVVTKTFPEGKKEAIIAFHYDANTFPTDAKLNVEIIPKGTNIIRITIIIHRPDKHKITIYDKTESITERANRTIISLFIRRESEISHILVNHFKLNVSPDIVNNLCILFGEESQDMWTPAKAKPLKGSYVLIIRTSTFEGEVKISKVKLTLYANAYGLMGTDSYRRDLFLGLLWGFPIALLIGIVTSFLTTIVGVIYAVISAYYGGYVDEVMQRIVDIVSSIPVLPVLILCAMIFGPKLIIIIGILVALTWTGGIKTIRAMVFQIREAPYIEMARVAGASTRWIILRHILPQVLPYSFYLMVIGVPGYILTEAGLSYLGLGDPTLPTWGQILHDASIHGAALCGYWWWVIPPGILIALVGLSFAMIGVAVDKILNPKLKY